MSKEMAIVALGVWVVVMPYLGIYRSWLTVFMVLTGIALMVLGFLLRGEVITKEHKAHRATPKHGSKDRMPFEESTAMVEQDYSERA
jgi:hypothetical protein